MQDDRTVAISQLVELIEHQGMKHYVLGYLVAHLETEQLENAVHSAQGFMESLNDQAPHFAVIAETSVYDPRD